MWSSTIYRHVLFIMAVLTRFVLLSQPSLSELNKVIAGIQKVKEKEGINDVCDETDGTGNWNIYCSGTILAAINLHRLEVDSKTFVDRPLKSDPQFVLKEFKKAFGKLSIDKINAKKLVEFRKRFFGEPGMELKSCHISEWRELPPKIARIKDRALKNFAVFLNRRWKDLCRQIIKIENPRQNSLIEVPHQFIVPGGRFREFYYWDAYWIVKAELLCTFRIILHFRFGFVPNGGRVYYLKRSQPPFLIPMVYEYYEATRDTKFIKENFDHLVKEYEFWVNNRSMKIKDEKGYEHIVYQYRTVSNVPRPESFRADIEVATKVGEKDRRKFFQDLASAAESGWTFSSRWFRDRKTLQTIETTNILPVDLNALICWNTNILKYFSNIIGKEQKAEEFENKRLSACKALNAIFYNKTEKAWFDFNLRTKSHNVLFYPSAIVPLYTNCYEMLDYDKSAKVIDYMNRSRAFNYPSGIPTSLKETGQQWDFPNGWPPMQHIIIEGMRKSDNPDAQEMAFKLARKWILANYKIYETTKKMWEKVVVTGTIPEPGVGGEYDVQDGFGWTNGVILDLLVTYSDRMTIAGIGDELTPKPIKPCRKKTNRIDYNIIIMIMLHAIIFYFAKCAFPLQI
uniref:Trehalase n=1 Tax=Onchocerca volvulus TaxID=6282 RepID=A0A8R1TXH5_ONCVO